MRASWTTIIRDHPANSVHRSVDVGPVTHRKGRISAALLVELPGIEPAAEIHLTEGTLNLTTRNNVKVPESTCGYARRVDDINMGDLVSTPRQQTPRQGNDESK
jgi:hypothetical protein